METDFEIIFKELRKYYDLKTSAISFYILLLKESNEEGLIPSFNFDYYCDLLQIGKRQLYNYRERLINIGLLSCDNLQWKIKPYTSILKAVNL